MAFLAVLLVILVFGAFFFSIYVLAEASAKAKRSNATDAKRKIRRTGREARRAMDQVSDEYSRQVYDQVRR